VALFTSGTYGFNAVNLQHMNIMRSTSSSSPTVLHLIPSQGCQLAAASEAALAKKKLDQENPENGNNSSRGSNSNSNGSQNIKHLSPSDATREFVSRLFHLPSQFNNHNKKQQKDSIIEFKIPGITNTNTNSGDMKNNDSNYSDDTGADVVLFPIVGFQYVKLQDGSIRGIPTCNAVAEKAVCNIDAVHMSQTQPLHGWYSKCCLLGNVYVDDHDEYCGEKRRREWERVAENGFASTNPHPSEMMYD